MIIHKKFKRCPQCFFYIKDISKHLEHCSMGKAKERPVAEIRKEIRK